KKAEAAPLVDIAEQNQQLEEAERTKGRRRRSRFTSKDKGDAQTLPGKKFDEWVWRSPLGDEVKIPVRVVKERERRYSSVRDRHVKGDTKLTYFQVVMPEYAINEADTDIESLREKVFKAIEVPFEIEWEPYLFIEIEGGDYPLKTVMWKEWGLREPTEAQTKYDDNDGLNGKLEIEIEVSEWELGTTKQGRKVSRSLRHSKRLYQVRKGWPEEEAEGTSFNGYCNKVLLPNTPENRLALESLIQGISAFREQLDRLLHPDVAAKLFQEAAKRVVKALPAPKKEKRQCQRTKKPKRS
ncbi:hypothetical protein LCGC14_2065680, partial [marine sediment metagenome]